jgi:hypothetical protein
MEKENGGKGDICNMLFVPQNADTFARIKARKRERADVQAHMGS